MKVRNELRDKQIPPPPFTHLGQDFQKITHLRHEIRIPVSYFTFYETNHVKIIFLTNSYLSCFNILDNVR